MQAEGGPAIVSSRAEAVRRQRVIGALVGSVVGDALGAPFEFGPGGEFSRRFPMPARGIATEMCGGGPWGPGEWTDDTQMAVLVAASLLDRGGLDEADLFDRFRRWAAADPKDIGIQTSAVLLSGQPWDTAAAVHFARTGRAAGNGSLMRTTPAAIAFSRAGVAATVDAARRISGLTHGDPAAGDACAIYHRLVAAALDGGDPLGELDAALAALSEDRRAPWTAYLSPDWDPHTEPMANGAVWPTLATAVWALRRYTTFEQTMRAVVDIGGDTDTIAAVAGGLLGATYGIQVIPSRWTTVLHGDVPGHEREQAVKVSGLADLQLLALRLDGVDEPPPNSLDGMGIEPVEVLPGLWLSDLAGAPNAPKDAVVISLCRTYDLVTHADRRQVYVSDDDANLDLATVLTDVLDTIEAVHADGRPVLVHCYAGASRTGMILRGYLMRTKGLDPAAATDEAARLWPHLHTLNGAFTDALGDLVSADFPGSPSAPLPTDNQGSSR